MGFFFRKSLLSLGTFNNYVDYHSHILPGVDDGVKTMEESLAILKYFESIGIIEVWCTPHVMEEMPNEPEQLKKVFATLTEAYKGSIKLYLSAEHMLDPLFEKRLEEGNVLPYGLGGEKILVETSCYNHSLALDKLLDRIIEKGFTPVLAHPERYVYMSEDEYERMSDRGVLFQQNILSRAGYYGEHVRQRTERLMEREMYSFSGTDIHNLGSFIHGIKKKSRYL